MMDKRIHLFIDNELSPSDKQAFEKELSENKQLREDYEKMTGLLKLAGARNRHARAPQDITDRIMETIERPQGHPYSLLRFLRIAAAIAIVIATGAGVFTYVHRENNLVNITFRVRVPDAKTVYVMGSFNQWGDVPEQLRNTGNGLFTLTLKLKPGIYQYVYKVDDNEILSDPHARLYTQDGFGQRNAILIVKHAKQS